MGQIIGLGHALMGDPDPHSNISHSPIMGLSHLIYQYFKLAQEIHTGEQTVQPKAYIVGAHI